MSIPLARPVTEPLVISFVNTLTRVKDDLGTPSDAERWIGQHLSSETRGAHVRLREVDLLFLRLLRDEIAAMLDHFESKVDDASRQKLGAVARINDRLRALSYVTQLDASGRSTRVRMKRNLSTLDGLVDEILDSLVRLSDQGGLAAVRTCGAPDCTLRFSDRSGRKKWCSPTACGNRERVRRHYRRRAESG